MSRLFIFGIGGTGARVIKALTFLLSAGVDIKATEIVPILLDPDSGNGDLQRAEEALKNYQRIRKVVKESIKTDKIDFFKADLKTLDELAVNQNESSNRIASGFRFQLKNVQGDRFRDYIDHGSLDEKNQDFINLLFSQKNLDLDMEVGFKGNPNIGSVVLNQFKNSDEFKYFATSFNQNDRIFIISSIFGGTGASGFPLLLKNIREADVTLPNFKNLQDARIGAVTVLPYFGVAPDEKSEINMGTFLSKTKAALSYYERNISNNKSLNAMYYIGDTSENSYANHEGSTNQKNDAHFVEVASALAIVDFMNIDDSYMTTVNKRATEVYYKEFGLNKPIGANGIQFLDMGISTQKIIKSQLTRYMYFNLYLRDEIENALNKNAHPWLKDGNNKITKSFLTSPFYEFITIYNSLFSSWLVELSRNKKSFSPFNLGVNGSNLFQLLSGIEPNKKIFDTFKSDNYDLFNGKLNESLKAIGDLPVEQKFMGLFSQATKKLINEKFANMES
ncbi:MAG: hypothetical protein KBF93_18300 [Leptospiraceae bacterium]|nr:hypothetical protein [Leptospiraceae bacterium]